MSVWRPDLVWPSTRLCLLAEDDREAALSGSTKVAVCRFHMLLVILFLTMRLGLSLSGLT